MTSIMEVLLLELLRKEGIVTDEQAVNITSAFQLFELLQQMKVVPPLTNADKKVIKDWEFPLWLRALSLPFLRLHRVAALRAGR